MSKPIHADQVPSLLDDGVPLIDVRSPSEFARGHIPGSVNIPLFSDDERAAVGTAYVQQGRDVAVRLGLRYAGARMAGIVEQTDVLAVQAKRVAVTCWRGGMRSESVAWLLETAGYSVLRVQGGYKAWRAFCRSRWTQPLNLCVLGGLTGSGKTAVLHELAAVGQQVVDLEGLAHHRGSAFGRIGNQPTQEQFENELGLVLARLDSQRPIWLEDESRCIGTIHQPDDLYAQLTQAPVCFVEVPRGERLRTIVREYGDRSREDLETSFSFIRKRLGGLRYKNILAALAEGDIEEAASQALDYYDRTYVWSLRRRDAPLLRIAVSAGTSPREVARTLVRHLEEATPTQPASRVLTEVHSESES